MAAPVHSVSFAFPGGALRVDSDDPEPVARLRTVYRAFPPPATPPAEPDLRLVDAGRGRLRLHAEGAPPGVALSVDDLLPTLERTIHRLLVERLGVAGGNRLAPSAKTPSETPAGKWLAPSETPAGNRLAPVETHVAEGETRWLAPCYAVLSPRSWPLALHAAAVERHGRAWLLPAASGRGKTTLAAALAVAGCGYLGDELTFLAGDGAGRLLAVPFPKAPSLKPGSLPLFAHLGPVATGGGEAHLDPERLRAGCTVTAPLPVGGVLVPCFEAGAGAGRLEQLSAGATLLALVGSAADLPHRPRRGKLAAFGCLGDLAAAVTGRRLTYGDAFAAARRLLEVDPWPSG